MQSIIISELCEKLVKNGIATYSKIRGCSSKEIEELENFAGYSLPEIYKQFLSQMGFGAGNFFRGTDIFYGSVFENRIAMNELLEEDQSDFELGLTDFVFASHQGYEFMYFSLCENADPSVHYYIEGEKFPYKKWEKFSEFLIQSVEDTINFNKDLSFK